MLNEKLDYSLARMFNRNSRYCKIKVNDSMMYIDFNDGGISRQLYFHKKRERHSTDYMKEIVREQDIIIDIGANSGYYALLESRLAHKGKVYAIEPVPKNAWLLNQNIDLNNYKNISWFPLAIGGGNDEGEMYVYEKGNLCSFTKNIQNEYIEKITVPIMTLDSFIEKYVSGDPALIRMDVEGYEYQIIKGMLDILSSGKPLILFIELHPFMMSEYEMHNLIKTLKQNNFKVKAIFLEPSTSDYGSVNVINKIFKKLDLPELGYAGKGYDKLKQILRKRDFTTSMTFFQRGMYE
ncbi:FkbM family methyltransferase [candidate division WOR-3 bacterium]|nr:FkbM family methyltransferase [candidate division WOR-3 bacterium]